MSNEEYVISGREQNRVEKKCERFFKNEKESPAKMPETLHRKQEYLLRQAETF